MARTTFSGPVVSQNGFITDHTPGSANAVNATGTATAAQVASGYITSTSAAATVITLPTGTLLGAAVSATQGTVLDLFIDNTAGANTVTIAVASHIVTMSPFSTMGALALASSPESVDKKSLFKNLFIVAFSSLLFIAIFLGIIASFGYLN